MPITVIIHVAGEEAVVGQIDDFPGGADNSVVVKKVRRRDGKPVHYLAPGVETVIWPLNRLTFIEIVPERAAREAADVPPLAVPIEAPEPLPAPEPPTDALTAAGIEDAEEAVAKPTSRLEGIMNQRRERHG